jgi:RNA polymerase sigma-70 factor, ECF subfamily
MGATCTATSGTDSRPAAFERWKDESPRLESSDAEWIEEFESLYKTYSLPIYCLCLRMTGNRDDAEDLTQETFVRLFQKHATFRGESAFYTWLRRLAINVVLLGFDKAYRRRETSLEELAEPNPLSGGPARCEFGALDSELQSAVERVCLERAIEQLPRGFRNILVLHDVEGYEHSEISLRNGCTVGTSKSQLHKARLRMRELLHDARREAPEQRLAA